MCCYYTQPVQCSTGMHFSTCRSSMAPVQNVEKRQVVLQAVGNLLRVRTLVLQHIAKQDEEKTTDFLCAGSPYCALLYDALF